MTTPLNTLQSAFQTKLLVGNDDILAHLSDGGPFMKVYEDGYTLRLLQILAEDFTAVHSLLGDAEFEKAMRGYLKENPSQHPSVRWLGQGVSRWLADTAPWNGHQVLADLSAFEWALGLSFDGPDADVLDVSTLSEIAPTDWPGLVFTGHPSLYLVDLQWDVVPFQQAIKHERDPESAPKILDRPVTWATWRHPQDLSVYHRRLEDKERSTLAAVLDGASFSEMCEMLTQDRIEEGPEMQAAAMLAGWINSGWISKVSIPNANT